MANTELPGVGNTIFMDTILVDSIHTALPTKLLRISATRATEEALAATCAGFLQPGFDQQKPPLAGNQGISWPRKPQSTNHTLGKPPLAHSE